MTYEELLAKHEQLVKENADLKAEKDEIEKELNELEKEYDDLCDENEKMSNEMYHQEEAIANHTTNEDYIKAIDKMTKINHEINLLTEEFKWIKVPEVYD